jgi:hypothetical protein
MRGISARFGKVLVLVGLALAVTASSGAAGSPARARILGVVPHHAGQLAPAPMPHAFSRAIRAAGPATLTFDAKYQSAINQFFIDVAHDSGDVNHNNDNVYAVAKEYYDNPGTVHIQYQSTFGGSYVDHNPLPANGCNDGLDTYCLTDQQLQNEIQKVLTAKGWHGGLDHVFFLMTPNGVGSCESAAGNCSTDTFCAYHSAFVDSNNENVIYANEPYEGTDPLGGCIDPEQGFPNDPDADTTINTISHEHNEAITDPLTDPSSTAWIAADGNENGDLCAYGFGAPLGTANGQPYNQLINNHQYSLQQEWSNQANQANGGLGGCIQRPGDPNPMPPTFGHGPLLYEGGPVMHTNTVYAIYWLPTARNTTAPALTGTAVVNQTLKTTAGSWAGGATAESYQWQRCSSTGTSCANIPGATATTYKLTTADGGHVVRSTVRATNVNGVSPPAGSAGTKMVVDVPAPTKAPHISGRARVGKKLLGSHGSWTYPATYRYQWLRCNAHGASCKSIPHATHAKYKLTKRDTKHRLRLRVTATNAAGRVKATSAASARIGR